MIFNLYNVTSYVFSLISSPSHSPSSFSSPSYRPFVSVVPATSTAVAAAERLDPQALVLARDLVQRTAVVAPRDSAIGICVAVHRTNQCRPSRLDAAVLDQ